MEPTPKPYAWCHSILPIYHEPNSGEVTSMQERALDITSKALHGVPALSFRSRLVLGNPSAPLFPSLCTRDNNPTYCDPLPHRPQAMQKFKEKRGLQGGAEAGI